MDNSYENISPLYMQKLKGRIEEAFWNLFDKSKYRQIEEYLKRWHIGEGFYENFCIYHQDDHIDLSLTLSEIPNDILIRIAADIGVETPGILPCIPTMKNILNHNNTNAYTNFERAIKNVYDNPDQSVALAASTLEGIFKTIIASLDVEGSKTNPSLSELTNKVVKNLIGSCDPEAPREIKTLAGNLRALGNTIDDLRSDKSTAHGKAEGEYVVDDELWAETVVNTTATLGILLWRLFERKNMQEDQGRIADELPF